MACRTTARCPRRRMAAKRSGRSESQLMLTRRSPARASSGAILASAVPLVVNARSSNPSAASRSTRQGSPLRTSGSPPVRRTERTPSPRATPATRVISSKVRRSSCSEEGQPLLGHAVDAAQVAAIGDRDPQVVVDPPVGVDQRPLERHRLRHRALARSTRRGGLTAIRTGVVALTIPPPLHRRPANAAPPGLVPGRRHSRCPAHRGRSRARGRCRPRRPPNRRPAG